MVTQVDENKLIICCYSKEMNETALLGIRLNNFSIYGIYQIKSEKVTVIKALDRQLKVSKIKFLFMFSLTLYH